MGILRSALLEDAGFRHGFAERSEGPDSIARTLGVSRVIQVKQVHGGRTIDASEVNGTNPDAEADAIVSRATTAPWAVGVRVADCVPILVANADNGDVVAIHAGWRGVVAEVVRGAVAELGGRNLLAAIGPCIGGCCFEVDRSVAEAIAGASRGARVVARWEGDKAWVDLRTAVRAQLTTLDSKNVRVEDVAGCTKHEPSRFHSFRRDGDRSGRMLSAIRARSHS
jgi:polyphenol oxidase